MRRPGPRRHVPVDLADVVLDRLVRPDLRQLAAPPEQRRPVVAGQHALDAACDRQVERPQQRLRHRARPGPGRRLPPAEQPFDHAARPARSSCGTGTAATISSSRLSGLPALGQGLVREHHAVAQRVLDELLQVLDEHVLAAAHDGEPAGRVDERDRAARACAERDEARQIRQPELVRATRRGRELERIADEPRIDVDPAHDLLDRAEVVEGEQLLELGRGHQRALDDRQLLVVLRVVDEDLEHEAVDLRLGQRIGALRLDRVLRGHDEERIRHGMGRVPERDLAFLHDLEEGRLDLRGRAVDLVREQEVAEHGAELGVEGRIVGPVDPRPDEVGGHEVRRELDAVERAAEHVGGRLHRERLGKSRDALDQEMATGQEADEHALQHLVLTRDDPPDLEQRLLES